MKQGKAFKFLLICVAMLLFVVTASVASAAAPGMADDGYPTPRVVTDRALKVGYITEIPQNESTIRWIRQTHIEAAHRGWDFIFVPVNRAGDLVREAMINLINQEVDAIMLNNLPMEPLADLIIQARQEGIGVYNNDSQLMEGCITNATMSNGVTSMEMFYLVGNLMKWKANICFNNLRALQVHPERADPAVALCGRAYPGMIMLDEQDVDLAKGFHTQQVFDFTKVWLTRFGEDIDVIFCTWDGAATGAAEAIATANINKKILVTGIDGGSRTWAYIRDPNSVFKYSYAQPFELYTHKLGILIDQLQVQGLQPGHPDVELSSYGSVLYSQGVIVGPNNVPEVGQSIHSVFNYYGGDPNDPNAWYNWKDGEGPYIITDGTE